MEAKLGDLREVLRYGFSGSLLFVFLMTSSSDFRVGIQSAGEFGGALLMFALGAAFHVAYKGTIGRFLLFPLIHRLCHMINDRSRCRHTVLQSELGAIDPWMAWECLRSSEILPSDARKNLYRQHSENHSAYQAFLVLLSAAIVQFTECHCLLGVLLTAAAALTLAGGLVSDVNLCMTESIAIRMMKDFEVRKILQDARLTMTDGTDDPVARQDNAVPAPASGNPGLGSQNIEALVIVVSTMLGFYQAAAVMNDVRASMFETDRRIPHGLLWIDWGTAFILGAVLMFMVWRLSAVALNNSGGWLHRLVRKLPLITVVVWLALGVIEMFWINCALSRAN